MPNPSPNPMPAKPVLPYATPQYMGQNSEHAPYWRRGAHVVVAVGSRETPCHCFKCGKPSSMVSRIYPKTEQLIGQATTVPILIPLCEDHGNRLLKMVKITRYLGWSALFLFFSRIFLPISLWGIPLWGFQGFMVKSSVACFFGWIILLTWATSVATVVQSDFHFVTLKGAGKEFLDKLPEM